MGLTKQEVREVLGIYIRAWREQDPGLIVTIFTESATYHERVLQEPIPDREAIRAYGEDKVVRSQANIKCRLLLSQNLTIGLIVQYCGRWSGSRTSCLELMSVVPGSAAVGARRRCNPPWHQFQPVPT